REGSQTKIVAKGCNHTCITTQAPVTVDGESGFAFFEEAIEAVIVTFTGGNARFFEACQQFKSLDEGVVVQVGGNAVFSKPNKRHAIGVNRLHPREDPEAFLLAKEEGRETLYIGIFFNQGVANLDEFFDSCRGG